jgi:DNA-directed RNA polymerase specialized sigma24 family protein
MNMLRADESADVIPYEVVFERYQRYADRVFEVFGIESPEDREDLVQELFMDFLKVSHSTPQKNVRAWIAKLILTNFMVS